MGHNSFLMDRYYGFVVIVLSISSSRYACMPYNYTYCQKGFTGMGTIIWLIHAGWSDPGEYWWIDIYNPWRAYHTNKIKQNTRRWFIAILTSGLAMELLQFWTKPSNSYICSPYAALLIARGLHIHWYLFIFLYDCACINHENTLCTIFIFSRRNNQYVVHRFPPWTYVEIGQ